MHSCRSICPTKNIAGAAHLYTVLIAGSVIAAFTLHRHNARAGGLKQAAVYVHAHKIPRRRRSLLIGLHRQVPIYRFDTSGVIYHHILAHFYYCRTCARKHEIGIEAYLHPVRTRRGVVVLQIHVEIGIGSEGDAAAEVHLVVARATVDGKAGHVVHGESAEVDIVVACFGIDFNGGDQCQRYAYRQVGYRAAVQGVGASGSVEVDAAVVFGHVE